MFFDITCRCDITCLLLIDQFKWIVSVEVYEPERSNKIEPGIEIIVVYSHCPLSRIIDQFTRPIATSKGRTDSQNFRRYILKIDSQSDTNVNVSTLAAQWSEQPCSVREVHGSNPEIMNFFHIVLYCYIPFWYVLVHTQYAQVLINAQSVHCMSAMHTHN
jgi:hypothetical protein